LVGPGKALPTHHQKQLGVWDPGAFPVPEKLNFHVLVQLVDRHNPKAQAGGLERRLVAYANWIIAISRLTAGSRANTSCSGDRNPILGSFTVQGLVFI
jgi:hypothetical protein